MQKKITRAEIENIIRHKDVILKMLYAEEEKIHREMVDRNTIIIEAALPSPSALMLNDAVSSNVSKDLYDTVERYQKLTENLNASIKNQLNEIADEKEKVLRVLLCLKSIKKTGKYYDVLCDNLINETSIEVIAKNYRRSPGTVSVWKRKAIEKIIELYEFGEFSSEMLREVAAGE